MLRGSLVILLFIAVCTSSLAQKKKKAVKPAQDTAAIFHDMFRGELLNGKDTIFTFLVLDHKKYHDEGAYTMDETLIKKGRREVSFQTPGTWTVLRETMNDEDVTIVELDNEEEILYFLRKNDSTLQRTNGTRDSVLQPVSMYTLRRVKERPVTKDSLTEYDNNMLRIAGAYKGNLPCGDCKALTTSLSLRFKKHARFGDYTLTDKYLGTKNGDITNERKGKWTCTSKRIEADRKSQVIVLDPDKKGRETYYVVVKRGIVQVDNNMHPLDTPGDKTLRRQ